jgi:hypothetical protein
MEKVFIAPNPDLEDLEAALAADSYHSGQTAAQWAQPNGELMTFADKDGVLYHIRIEKVLRVHFQHSPSASKRRLAVGMKHGIEWLKDAARKSGHREIIFNSTAQELVEFFARFGFHPMADEHKAEL